MNLLEHEGKAILARFGLPVPRGEEVRNPVEARAAAARLGGRCMVKAQVPIGGRGKLGLIKLASDSAAASTLSAHMFGVRAVLPVDVIRLEACLDIASELYLAIRIDDVLGCPVLLASVHGGIDIETQTDGVVSQAVDVLEGLLRHDAVRLWKSAGLAVHLVQPAAELAVALWKAFWESDADLMEINPLVVDGAGKLWCADAKVIINDNALPRHPEFNTLQANQEGTDLERRARRLGVNSYIDLGGSISVVTSGASLGMLVIDQLTAAGGQPANFMDMGGGAVPIAREKLIELALYKTENDPSIRTMFMAFVVTSKSIQITVDAIRGALGGRPLPCPVFAWISAAHVATEEVSLDYARQQLRDLGINAFEHMQDAVAAAVQGARS